MLDELLGWLLFLSLLAVAIVGLIKKEYKVEPTHNTSRCIEYDNGILDGRIEFIDLNPHWVSKSILPKCKKWEKKN